MRGLRQGVVNHRRLALSFDVECYYQVVTKDFLGRAIAPTEEVLVNTTWILDLLAEFEAKATFFFLGNVADRYPQLVRRAVDDGHEIGVHGDVHDYVRDMDQPQFRSEIERGMKKIRAAGGKRIAGHRATAFSITRDNLWALETLRELGIEYDSSIFPFAGVRYGISDWPRCPGMTVAGIAEVPMSVVSIAGRTVPCMGGGYVRYFPLAFTLWCARRLHRQGLTPVCYFHPYEFERQKPSFARDELGGIEDGKLRQLRRFNLMQGIGRGRPMRRKLERLVRDFEIVTVGSLATGT
jgi:polysaccharide deacetylase family protein (PEP-CTERM system associated)